MRRALSASSAKPSASHPTTRRRIINWHWRCGAAAHERKRSRSTKPRAGWPRISGGNIHAMFRAWRCAATVIAALAVVMGHGRAAPLDGGPLAFSFTNVARGAGLDAVTTFGGTDANKYLL